MYVRPSAPPGLHPQTDTQHFATAWCSEEPLVNADVRDKQGHPAGAPCQPSVEKLTAEV
jgi:hypothetical protein